MNPVPNRATKEETEAALQSTIAKLAAEGKTALPKPSAAAVVAAAKDFAFCLRTKRVEYYLCGGFACVYLCGSGRTTADIDIVAKDNANYGLMFQTLEEMPNVAFNRPLSESPLYYHKTSNEFVEMDCLPAGWGGNFPRTSDKGFGLERKDEIDFLIAPELLRLKFRTWADPARALKPEKVNGDKLDILALRKFLRYSNPPRRADQSNWGKEENDGLKAWIKQYKDSDDWKAIGLQG